MERYDQSEPLNKEESSGSLSVPKVPLAATRRPVTLPTFHNKLYIQVLVRLVTLYQRLVNFQFTIVSELKHEFKLDWFSSIKRFGFVIMFQTDFFVYAWGLRGSVVFAFCQWAPVWAVQLTTRLAYVGGLFLSNCQ